MSIQPSTTNTLIESDSNLDDLRARIGIGDDEELRSAPRRRDHLQKFSRVMSASDVHLSLDSEIAVAGMMEDGSMEIQIPSNELPQPVTDFNRRIYDLLVQETLTLHEVGHLLYTDYAATKAVAEEYDGSDRNLFMHILNCLEDGAVDLQLRSEFNATRDFITLYANLTAGQTIARTIEMDGADQTVYTFHDAVVTALLDLGIYDSGNFTALLDPDCDEATFAGGDEDRELFMEFLPEIESAVVTALSEPDPTERVYRAQEFFESYRTTLDDAKIEGVNDSQDQQSRMIAGSSGMEYSDLDSKGNAQPGAAVPARHLPSSDQVRQVMRPTDSESTVPGSVTGSIAAGDLPDGFTDAIEDDYNAEVRREADEASDGVMDEIETMHELLNGAGGEELGHLAVAVPEPTGQVDHARWAECCRRSAGIEETFRRRLQREQASRMKTHQRRGTISKRTMLDAERGSLRVFEQTVDPHDKEYAAMIVQDRSGSMDGPETKIAESAVTALSMALEGVGVSTAVMDFYDDKPRIISPFDSPVEDRRDVLMGGESGGGTPLAEVIALARNRFELQGAERPFMIVVTDDAPNDTERYLAELQRCNFPVLGVRIRNHKMMFVGDRADTSEYFHRSVEIDDIDQLHLKLRQLAEEAIID